MSKKTTFLNDELYEYLLQVSLREPEILKDLRARTALLKNSQMQIAPEQGQFMSLMIHLMNAKRTLEVGLYTGYSALCVAMALPKEGEIIACDVDEETTKIASEFFQKANMSHKLKIALAPAQETLANLIEKNDVKPFDFVFIDADKTNYEVYYEQALQLIRPGGCIAFDNTLWEGDVINLSDHSPSTEAIRQLNKKLHMDRRVDISLVPIGDGLTLVRKKVD